MAIASDHSEDSSLSEENPHFHESIVRENNRFVIGVAFSICGNVADAHDVAQEVWIKVIKSPPKTFNNPIFRGWLYQVTRTTALDKIDKEKSYRDKIKAYGDLYSSLIGIHLGQKAEERLMDSLNKLRDAYSKLPEHYQQTLQLKYWQKMKYEEIAEEMGVGLSSVKNMLTRAKKRLREALGIL